MYNIVASDLSLLDQYGPADSGKTVYLTRRWVSFLIQNQKAEPVILRIEENGRLLAIFVGLVTRRMGMRILGSPFEGWLTPDMGFIRLQPFDAYQAASDVAHYAFRRLGCWYAQIADKRIHVEDLPPEARYTTSKIVFIDNSRSLDDILAGFAKNGRRYVRSSQRKGAYVKRVPFDRAFMDEYYRQLIDVFDKQGLKPFYSLKKLYDMVDAFEGDEDDTLALMAYSPEGEPIASILALGHNEWAYYVGGASYRPHQHYLPNDLLFWHFIQHWHAAGKTKIDLMGVRAYKLKYNPEFLEQPVLYFERVPGIGKVKRTAKKLVASARKCKTALSDRLKKRRLPAEPAPSENTPPEND